MRGAPKPALMMVFLLATTCQPRAIANDPIVAAVPASR